MLGPILYWDLVRTVRRASHFQQRTVLASAAFAFVVFATMSVDTRSLGAVARLSENIAQLSFRLQSLAIYLFVPAMLAGSICEDRRTGRLSLLLATPMTQRQIVVEKFLVGVGLASVAVLVMLPFILLGPIMGGVEPNDALRLELAAFVETAFVAAATLMFSARSNNSSEALVKSYAFLFAVRFLLPHVDTLADVLAPGRMTFWTGWAWIEALSPGSAVAAAWSSFGGATANEPSYVLRLLIASGFAAAALAVCVVSLDREPKTLKAAGKSATNRTDEALLDADPLVWRALRTDAYDRSGVWRRSMWVLGVVFAGVVWVGFAFGDRGFGAVFTVAAVVFFFNAGAPAQWLINDRTSGWLAELQLTPLSMDDILRASVVGSARRLRTLWILAAAACVAAFALLFVRGWTASAASLLVFVFFLYWPAWSAFWSSVRHGYHSESTAGALANICLETAGRQCLAGFLAVSGVSIAATAAFLPNVVNLLAVAMIVVTLVLYAMVHVAGKDACLRKARTALFMMERTSNFGRKSASKAWEDWVGVARTAPNQERLIDVYRAKPSLSRPTST